MLGINNQTKSTADQRGIKFPAKKNRRGRHPARHVIGHCPSTLSSTENIKKTIRKKLNQNSNPVQINKVKSGGERCYCGAQTEQEPEPPQTLPPTCSISRAELEQGEEEEKNTAAQMLTFNI